MRRQRYQCHNLKTRELEEIQNLYLWCRFGLYTVTLRMLNNAGDWRVVNVVGANSHDQTARYEASGEVFFFLYQEADDDDLSTYLGMHAFNRTTYPERFRPGLTYPRSHWIELLTAHGASELDFGITSS